MGLVVGRTVIGVAGYNIATSGHIPNTTNGSHKSPIRSGNSLRHLLKDFNKTSLVVMGSRKGESTGDREQRKAQQSESASTNKGDVIGPCS